MARRVERVSVTIEDVNGSFARLVNEAPREARAFLSQAVATGTTAVAQRMRALAPEDEGDMKAAIETKLPKRNRLSGQAGVFDEEQAHVAMYNEYHPNRQAFMRPAAQDEANTFRDLAERALKKLETAFKV